jgi:single-strand DNA-binding protein
LNSGRQRSIGSLNPDRSVQFDGPVRLIQLAGQFDCCGAIPIGPSSTPVKLSPVKKILVLPQGKTQYVKIQLPVARSFQPMSLNVVTLVGRVGGDPDVKYFESGSVKCRLTLAVNRISKNNDQPDWFTLELWGKQAEVAEKYVQKGKLIGVKGALKFDSWTDKSSGAPRTTPIILVDQLQLLGSKRDNEGGMDGGGGSSGFGEDF